MILGFASHAAVKFSFSVQWKIKTISLVSMTVTINLYLDVYPTGYLETTCRFS